MQRSLLRTFLRSLVRCAIGLGVAAGGLGCGGAPDPGVGGGSPSSGSAPRAGDRDAGEQEAGEQDRPSGSEARIASSILHLVIDDYGRRETREYDFDPQSRSVVVVRHRLGAPGVQRSEPITLALDAVPAEGTAEQERFEGFERDLGWFAAPVFGDALGATQIGLGHQPVPGGDVDGRYLCTEWSLVDSPTARRTRWYVDDDGRPVAVAAFTGDGSDAVEVLRGDGVVVAGDLRAPKRLFSPNGLEFELTELRTGR